MNTASIISKVWSFCNTLRDDGVGYGDYLEQLTYLIFLTATDGPSPWNNTSSRPNSICISSRSRSSSPSSNATPAAGKTAFAP
jgi:hypothetical protein